MFVNSNVENAKSRIKTAEIISFDIFDTLLLRPYLSPRDLFLHIEKEYGLSGFLLARRAAELSARKAKIEQEEVTYDDIYDQIHEKYKAAKQIELDWEYRVLVANPEMKLIWDYAKQLNKKIIIISDMYLPSYFLKNILVKNGFSDFDHFYVSSDLGKTKKKGSLFKYVLSDLGVTAENIFHIGDNKKGDFKIPRKLGINCLLYPQVNAQFLKCNKREKIFLENSSQNLGNSILLSLFALRWQTQRFNLQTEQYWHSIGYCFAAPIAYAYSRWIERTSITLNIDHLLFVARDGYLLQKVFKSFGSNIDHTYIYAPRLLNLTCRLDYDSKNVEQIKTIIDFFSLKSLEIDQLKKESCQNIKEDGHKFIQKNMEIFEKYAAIEYQNYKSYIQEKIKNSQKIALIDTKTIAFTSQKFIENILQKPLTGFYWSTIIQDKISSIQYFEFLTNNCKKYDVKIFSENWKFIETLLSSPEYPIRGITEDGRVIYEENPTKEEIVLKNNFEQIESGVDQFLIDIERLFGNANLYLDGTSLIEWVNTFCNYPTQDDICEMSGIKQATDVAHENYKPLFLSKVGLTNFCKHPRKSLNIMKNSIWKTPSQTLILSIFKPIKIKKQKNNVYTISIFPYLQKQYFFFWWRLLNRAQLKFIWGKFDKD